MAIANNQGKPSAGGGLLMRPGQPVRRFVYVAGVVLPDGTAQFEPFEVVATSEDIETKPREGNYSLVVERTEPAGTIERRFDPSTLSVGGIEEPRPFGLFLSYDESVTRIVLRDGSEELAERRPNVGSPQVTLAPIGKSPITGRQAVSWTAADPEHAELTFSVWYSADGGERFLPLAVGLKSTSVEIDFDRLPPSRSGLLRVQASNGLNTSESLSAPLEVGAPGPNSRF